MTTHKRTTAAVLLVLAAALTACQPVTTPTPPVAPNPSVSPAETEQERLMRLDKTAAEKAYLTTNAEAERLAMSGGASKPTKVLTDNTSGSYLKVMMNDLSVLKKNGWRTDQKTVSSVTANRGWSPTEVGLTACEDASQVRLLDKADKEANQDRPRMFVQTLTANKISGRWKISDVDSKIVKTFSNEAGCEP